MATTPFCRPVQSHCASLPLHRRLSCLLALARSNPTARPSLSTLGSPALSFCRSISVRRRLAAASKDTASDKGQEQEPSTAAGEALKSGVDETASGEKTPEEVAAELKEVMRARKEAEVAAGSTGAGAGWWDGVVQEMSEIEWPAPGKVLGTTAVVLGIITGSTAALLSVNAILAELSDRVFAGRGLQDFF